MASYGFLQKHLMAIASNAGQILPGIKKWAHPKKMLALSKFP
jgi:hypothetical protein